MTSIFISFINDKVIIVKKNGTKFEVLKPFMEYDGNFTTVSKKSVKLEFLPNEIPYSKGNIPFTTLTLYKGDIVSYLNETLEYFSNVRLAKEKFNEIYIITDNEPYVVPEFREIINKEMKTLFSQKYKGCFFIPYILEAILKEHSMLKMKDYLFISDTIFISSSYKKKKSLVSSLYQDPLINHSKELIEEIYHKSNLNLIYDNIPYEFIFNLLLGGVKKYMYNNKSDIKYKVQDRMIEVKEDDILLAYNELYLDRIKRLVSDCYDKDTIVSYYTDSEILEEDLEKITPRSIRMIFPEILFFNYVEFLGLINKDMYIKALLLHDSKDMLYGLSKNMGRNTKKYEKIYHDIFKDYKKYF